MSDATDLLKAATYSIRTENNKIRAKNLAQTIIEQFPDSDEAVRARALLQEIEDGNQTKMQPAVQESQSDHSPASRKGISCQQCGAAMKKTKRAESNRGVQAFGCAIFIVGIALLFLFPIGTIIGIAIMLGAASMGYKKSKVWLCPSCGYFFERN